MKTIILEEEREADSLNTFLNADSFTDCQVPW